MPYRFLIGFAVCAFVSIGMLGNAMAQQKETMEAENAQAEQMGLLFQSSDLSDLDVFNDQNQELGSLNNLIIDARSGQVLYGVLSTGLFTGKTIAVPWSAFRFSTRDNEHVLLLNKTEEQLSGAPVFDKDNMRNLLTSDQWRKTVNDFFGVRTAARPIEPQHQH